ARGGAPETGVCARRSPTRSDGGEAGCRTPPIRDRRVSAARRVVWRAVYGAGCPGLCRGVPVRAGPARAGNRGRGLALARLAVGVGVVAACWAGAVCGERCP